MALCAGAERAVPLGHRAGALMDGENTYRQTQDTHGSAVPKCEGQIPAFMLVSFVLFFKPLKHTCCFMKNRGSQHMASRPLLLNLCRLGDVTAPPQV